MRTRASSLRRAVALERKLFPGIASMLDREILVQVGHAEEAGHPLSPKQLYSEVPPISSCRRHLTRLVALGVIEKTVRTDDGRVVLLHLSARTKRAVNAYWDALVGLVREG